MNINVTLFAHIISFVLMIWFRPVLWGPLTRCWRSARSASPTGWRHPIRAHDLNVEKRPRTVAGSTRQVAEILAQSEKRAMRSSRKPRPKRAPGDG